jgi:hypothetical protein
MTMTAIPITSEQTKLYWRFVADAADRALKKVAPDKDGLQALLERGGEFQTHLLDGVRRFSTRVPVFPVYLDIEVGGKSMRELITAIESVGMFANDYSHDIMMNPVWKPGERKQVKFARAKIRDLGFTKNPTTRDVWARIQELGHSLCEPGDGPAIRLALTDQSRGDYFWVAMEQITDSDGDPFVFYVYRLDGGERWLHARWGDPDIEWDFDDEIVFRLRK